MRGFDFNGNGKKDLLDRAADFTVWCDITGLSKNDNDDDEDANGFDDDKE